MIEALRSAWSARRLAQSERGAVYVLAYHGLVPAITDARLERNFHAIGLFREQVRLLARMRTVPLSEIDEWLRIGNFPSRGISVAVTFDDGYRTTLDAGAILGEHRIPWTVFISTDAVERAGAIWTAELALLLLHGRAERLEIKRREWALADRTGRESAYQEIRMELKRLPAAERRAAMEQLRAQMPEGETERLLTRFPALRSMSWRDVGELAAGGVEIGGHGVMHELHHSEQKAETRRAELVEAKRAIEARTGGRCRYLSFPNGSMVPESAAEAEAAGYALAFTTEVGSIAPGSRRFALPRMPAGNSVHRLIARLSDPRQAVAHP